MSNTRDTRDLLIEIGVEELPPNNLQDFADLFGQNLDKAFKNAHLTFSSPIETFVAPRRLAAILRDLVNIQPEQTILKRGPGKAQAFDSQGKPTQAALGFAASCQTSIENITVQETEKGSFLVFEQKLKGQKSEDLIPQIIQDVLHNLPLTKRMRWGDSPEIFVRPIHWVTLLFGDTEITSEFFGIESRGATRGHRFHHPEAIPLKTPSEYEEQLKQGKVIASYHKRLDTIKAKLQEAIEKLNEEKPLPEVNKGVFTYAKAEARTEGDLLDQVTGLVEWPVVLMGKFNREFLELPKEVLISSMEVHQKCFPVLSEKSKKLLPYFLIVSNIESTDPETVIRGNERVMHARLHDAAFLYREDLKIRLEERRENLKNIIFQHGLGSLWDKSQRIAKLGELIANQIGFSKTFEVKRVAELCKADLSTQMVLEFPELQGVMGRDYYRSQLQTNQDNVAETHGDPDGIGDAIEGHYHPRYAKDSLPGTELGSIIAIADRLDSLVGLFALGKRPTGDKDPFAQRRQAFAILRIIIESDRFPELQQIDLLKLIHKAYDIYAGDKEKYSKLLPAEEVSKTLFDFFFERLRAWYHEQGFSARAFDAVLAAKQSKVAKQSADPFDFHKRLQAVIEFQKLPEAESLSAANKRVRNILEKTLEEHEVSSRDNILVNDKMLLEEAEKVLAIKLQEKKKEIDTYRTDQYKDALLSLATLKEPIDKFFDHVMVMVEDKTLRENRLNLLRQLRALFLSIADISHL